MPKPPKLTYAHTINQLTFGPNLESLAEQYKSILDLGAYRALAGHSTEGNGITEDQIKGSEAAAYNYYLNVVPNDFTFYFAELTGFQYTVTHHYRTGAEGGVWFWYEMSPISVKYFQDVPPV
jgi:hypothetical protein